MNFLGSISPIFYKLQIIIAGVKANLARIIIGGSIQGMLGRDSGTPKVADISEVFMFGDPTTTARTVAEAYPSTVNRATRISRSVIGARADRSGLSRTHEITNYGLSIHEGIIT